MGLTKERGQFENGKSSEERRTQKGCTKERRKEGPGKKEVSTSFKIRKSPEESIPGFCFSEGDKVFGGTSV
jgi:hypothetical protein